MKSSTQINTGPTLKQFATLSGEAELILTSKLGTSTLSRVRILRAEYPRTQSEQVSFIRERVMTSNPRLETLLGTMLEPCITDQAKAAEILLNQ